MIVEVDIFGGVIDTESRLVADGASGALGVVLNDAGLADRGIAQHDDCFSQ